MRWRCTLIAVRLSAVALALSLWLIAPGGAGAAEMVTRQALNLRVGPGLEYDIITVVPAGTIVTVTDDPIEGYYPVTVDDLVGWISGEGLGTDRPATVTIDGLNLREGPGLDYAIVTTLPEGTVAQLVSGPEYADDYTWVEIAVPGMGSGWVVADFLTTDE